MGSTGQVIVDSFVANGIDRVFCVAGASYLGLLNALWGRSDIDTVACRHEGGAGFMASTAAACSDRSRNGPRSFWIRSAPDRRVLCLVGDGGFLMTGNELAVASERGLSIKIILAENRVSGSIRIHQEREYPGRVIGTSLTNPDFELFGCTVTRIHSTDDLVSLPQVLDRPGLELVVVDTSLEAVLPEH